MVGPGEALPRPSAAAAIAEAGDRVLIRAGTYRDCAVWRVPSVTVEALGGPVVITGPVCERRGLFIAAASGLSVSGLTFRGARAPTGNGAGILAHGGSLTVRDSRFETNESGILMGGAHDGVLLVERSAFIGNGALRDGQECAHGIYAGRLGRVVIRDSRFEGTRICHHIKSRAAETEVTGTQIRDGRHGDSSYLIDLPNGGDALIRGNRLEKGPRSDNPAQAIALGFEGVSQPTARLLIENNIFRNRQAVRTAFVGNRTATPALLVGNRLSGPVIPLQGPGEVR